MSDERSKDDDLPPFPASFNATHGLLTLDNVLDRVRSDIVSAAPLPGTAVRPLPAVGSRFGRYQLEAIIGEGSTSVIYRGVSGATVVALKIRRPIPAHGFSVLEADRHFLEEGRLLARLDHPHVVKVLEVDVFGELPYLACELVDGMSLDQEIEHHGRVDGARVVSLAKALADALAVSHGQGILHRDVKPGNVLLRRDGFPKLADFGSAAGVFQDPAGGKSIICGSPAYMAPEQITHPNEVDHRADMYGLGATLYHAATGHPLFRRATPKETLRAQLHELPDPVSAGAPGLEPWVSELIMRLLEKRPEDRFARWDEVLAALNATGSRRPERRASSIGRLLSSFLKK